MARRGAHAARDRIVRNEPSIPDDSDELVLADDSVPVAYEMDQHVEHLWLDGDVAPFRCSSRRSR
jgi:hypothetical protein